ncbi:LOW QUALITY PROTEIN: protein CCSMST1 [Motacilla alba alba]|uniref:LOW QUALITY PROTEIN: protein CCSMST1 n=1 Tax=Motacilla alba alba TaxID=1094192 RepID=UPI0018D58DF9|nr:LOW QUALITY PROTEIN: protein CCSMST1 [Motacilla alba alba]
MSSLAPSVSAEHAICGQHAGSCGAVRDPPSPGSCRPRPHGGSCLEPRPSPPSAPAPVKRGLIRVPAVRRGPGRGRWRRGRGPRRFVSPSRRSRVCRCRARRAPCLPGPRRGLARRRNPEVAAGADPEGGGSIPFSGCKASPRFWSVSRSMGSDHERPSVKVLPLSVLGTGLLLWCVFREKRETDERLEAVLFGQIVDSDTVQESNAPLQLLEEN